MKKTGRFLLAGIMVFTLSIVLPGCEQESHIYDGPPVVEFSNFSWGLEHSTAARPHYTWVGTGSFWSTEIRGVRPDTSLQVQLVALHQPVDLTLSYRVVDTVYRHIALNRMMLTRPVGADGAPLRTGTDYVVTLTTATPAMFSVLNNGNITIPAGSSFGRLRIGLNPTTIPPPAATTRDIWIVLEPGTVQPSANFRVFRLRIRM